jgi:hypothetical protein
MGTASKIKLVVPARFSFWGPLAIGESQVVNLPPQLPNSQKLTPPQLSRLWGVDRNRIIGWIKSGQLQAIDGSIRQGQRPRYLIDAAAIREFEATRTVNAKGGER